MCEQWSDGLLRARLEWKLRHMVEFPSPVGRPLSLVVVGGNVIIRDTHSSLVSKLLYSNVAGHTVSSATQVSMAAEVELN